jgi:hypothetical protein
VFGVSLRVDEYAQGRVVKILTSCPICDYEFDPEERRRHHLGDHDPEDFGLTPLGEVADDHADPLFDDVVPEEFERTIAIGPLPDHDADGLVDHLASTGINRGLIAVRNAASVLSTDEAEQAVTIGPLPHEDVPGLVERLTNSGLREDAITVTDGQEVVACGD